MPAARISAQNCVPFSESAHGVRPDDKSEAASGRARSRAMVISTAWFHRQVSGVDPAKNNYPAKNTLLEAVTPDRPDWHPVEQTPKSRHGAPTTSQYRRRRSSGPIGSQQVK